LLRDQELHSITDFITDDTDLFDGLALGIAEWPVVSAEAGDVGAFVAAAHGDEKLRIAREFLGKFSRLRAAEIDADFPHGSEYFGMNARAGLGSGGDGLGFRAIGKLIEERGRHLRAARVVNTSKYHFEHRGVSRYEQQVGPQQVFAAFVVGLMA